jgi:hypothetical protein
MRIPIIRGRIDRRILVNFQVDPEVLASVLPQPFRPKLVKGIGIAGVCLIRLNQVRPRLLPALVGISSENAAHRIAVQWEEDGELCEGVYIPRRDTSSRLNALVGGRLFPGVHHHARFKVREERDFYHAALDSVDGETHLEVEGRVTSKLPDSSVFDSVQDASDFFERGSLGYSAGRRDGEFDGLELRTFNWQVQPLVLNKVESSFFDNQRVFPVGSVTFDCALLMRDIQHEWHGRPTLHCDDHAFQPPAMASNR